MPLHRDGLIVSLALAAATALYIFAFRDQAASAIGPLTPPPMSLSATAFTAG